MREMTDQSQNTVREIANFESILRMKRHFSFVLRRQNKARLLRSIRARNSTKN